MPSFSFNINVYGGDITFLPGVEKWINWFIETRVLRPYVLPERLTVPVKFLYDPTLEVTPLPLRLKHVLQVTWYIICKMHCACQVLVRPNFRGDPTAAAAQTGSASYMIYHLQDALCLSSSCTTQL